MRERITFIHAPGGGVDPAQLEIQDTKLHGPATEAVREHKVTLSLKELPAAISDRLKDIQELHLRWASPFSYKSLDPFSSRISPGLHVSYSPLSKGEHDPSNLCALLQAFGKFECTSHEVFTNLSEGRNARSPSLYFHQEVEDLVNFVRELIPLICSDVHDSSCRERLRELKSAAIVDISYESSSESVKLVSFWPLRKQEISVPSLSKERTEIGILGKDAFPGGEPHEVGVSGFLTVLGEKKEPSPALFAFPARHRSTESSFSSKFLTPTGLHPTLQLSLNTREPPTEHAECALHAYLTLPKTIFADRYQLADELFLASKNLSAAPYVSQPVDLEAPAYTTKTWGSNVLLQLKPPSNPKAKKWTAEVPLHLRYLEPSATGIVDIEVPYPVVFWACEFDGTDFDSPFDRAHLGYDGLFSPSTSFWHIPPKPESGVRLMNSISVPVVVEGASQWVGAGTSVVVGLGFLWVLWKLLSGLTSFGYGSNGVANAEEIKKTK